MELKDKSSQPIKVMNEVVVVNEDFGALLTSKTLQSAINNIIIKQIGVSLGLSERIGWLSQFKDYEIEGKLINNLQKIDFANNVIAEIMKEIYNKRSKKDNGKETEQADE